MVADDAKVILVTGASRGLGAAIAIDLGKQGQKVVVNYAGSKDKAEEVVEAVKAAGGDAIAVQADCEYLGVAFSLLFNGGGDEWCSMRWICTIIEIYDDREFVDSVELQRRW